mmetsp:Transcript_57415/g.101896  ORF Transcript_57415/g.101896 Transcript_57415/m.101896 type:complete len:1042 (-) Transcript_57415:82-3207(-)
MKYGLRCRCTSFTWMFLSCLILNAPQGALAVRGEDSEIRSAHGTEISNLEAELQDHRAGRNGIALQTKKDKTSEEHSGKAVSGAAIKIPTDEAQDAADETQDLDASRKRRPVQLVPRTWRLNGTLRQIHPFQEVELKPDKELDALNPEVQFPLRWSSDPNVSRRQQAEMLLTGAVQDSGWVSDTVRAAMPPIQWPGHIAWSVALALLLLSAYSVIYAFQMLCTCNSKLNTEYRIMYITSFISTPQYLVVIMPLVFSTLRQHLWPELLATYNYIPFWNIFCVVTLRGAYYHYCWDMFLGATLGIIVVFPMMLVVPAGIACRFHAACMNYNGPGMFGDNSYYFPVIFLFLSAHLLCSTNLANDCKTTALAGMGSLGLDYMNPLSDWRLLSPFIVDWDLSVNLKGAAACSLYIIVIAFSLRSFQFFCFPIETLSGGTLSYDCFVRAQQRVNMLAADVVQCMSFLLLRQDAMQFEIKDNSLKTKALWMQIKKIDEILAETWWQTWTLHQKLLLTQLHALSGWMKEQASLLILQDQILCDSMTGLSEKTELEALKPHLETYLENVTESVVDICKLDTSGAQDLQPALRAISESEKIVKALAADNKLSTQTAGKQLIILSVARTWATNLDKFQEGFPHTAAEDILSFQAWPIFAPMITWRGHSKALRHSLGFVMALIYAAYVRKFSPTVVVTYAMILQPDASFRQMIERGGARLFGIALGLIGGNLPAVVLCKKFVVFRSLVPGIIGHICAMHLTWLLACFGSLSGGAVGLSFMLWGAFGGMEMLRPLNALLVEVTEAEVEEFQVASFEKVIDVFTGVLILTLADSLFMRLKGKSSSKAGAALRKSLQTSIHNLEALLHMQDVDTSFSVNMRKDLDDALRLCSVAQRESEMTMAYWRQDFVNLLETELHSLCLYITALQLLQKSLGKEGFNDIISTVMPPGLISCLREYEMVLEDAFNEDNDDALTGFNPKTDSYAHVLQEQKLTQMEQETEGCEGYSSIAVCNHAICRSAKRIDVALRAEMEEMEWSTTLNSQVSINSRVKSFTKS